MRRWPYSISELAAMAVIGLFTAFGLVTGLVWPALFFGACLAIFVLSPVLRKYTPERPKESVEFDDTMVRRRRVNGTVESITWDELDAIDIVTTDEGPYVDDVFFLLIGRDPSRGCAISNEAKGFPLLLARLQSLPGFDNGAVIRAMTTAVNARFVVWRRSG